MCLIIAHLIGTPVPEGVNEDTEYPWPGYISGHGISHQMHVVLSGKATGGVTVQSLVWDGTLVLILHALKPSNFYKTWNG